MHIVTEEEGVLRQYYESKLNTLQSSYVITTNIQYLVHSSQRGMGSIDWETFLYVIFILAIY